MFGRVEIESFTGEGKNLFLYCPHPPGKIRRQSIQKRAVEKNPMVLHSGQNSDQRHLYGVKQCVVAVCYKQWLKFPAEQPGGVRIFGGILGCCFQIDLGEILLVPAVAGHIFIADHAVIEMFLCQGIQAVPLA